MLKLEKPSPFDTFSMNQSQMPLTAQSETGPNFLAKTSSGAGMLSFYLDRKEH